MVHELPSGSGRSVDELDTLLGTTPPRPPVTLEQVLQERTAQSKGGDRSSTQIVAELCALRDAWTSFERVVPSYEYKTRIWLVEHLISLGLVGVEPRGNKKFKAHGCSGEIRQQPRCRSALRRIVARVGRVDHGQA